MKCFVCNKYSWKNHFTKLLKCTNCGFIRAKDRYFKIREKDFYNLQYFEGIDYNNYLLEKPALVKNFKDRLKRIKKYKKHGRLLEIGCAFGYFLSLAEEYYQTTGVDLNSQITKIARKNSLKSKIITGNLLKIKIPKKCFDIIVMLDTIEHLKNPCAYLDKIKTVLKPKGILVIETGNIDAFLPKMQGGRWRLIYPPSHLSYFSKNTLAALLKNKGFTIKEIVGVPFYRSIRQTIYRLTKINLSWIPDGIGNFSFPLNTGDIIFIVAQKNN